MTVLTITSNNTSFLSAGDILVYGGKNGFTSSLGAVPVTCNTFTDNISSIVFSVPFLNLLIDDNTMMHLLEIPSALGYSSSYVKAPISQYATETRKLGSTGYTTPLSNTSLLITDYNISANTITVANQPYNGETVSTLFPAAPFYITLFQPLLANSFSNNSAFISGSFRSVERTYDVSFVFGDYVAELPVLSKNKKDVQLYLDDIQITNFTWTTNSVTVPLTGQSTQLRAVVTYYTVPALERDDVLSLSIANNTYSVANTSYQISDDLYDTNLTSNNFYKIRLNKAINSNVTAIPFVNISPDFVGGIANVTSTSFSLEIKQDQYPYTYELANNSIYYLYQKNKVRYINARPDEYGKIADINPGTYIVEATNINRYNRNSGAIKSLAQIQPLRLSKVSSISVSEQIFIDTTGGASITATISFPIIADRDVSAYEIQYRVLSEDESSVPEYTTVIVPQDESVSELRYTVNNLNRGRVPGANTLDIVIFPVLDTYKGFSTRLQHALIGKTSKPSGLTSLFVVQQENLLVYSWEFQLTSEGYVLDVDTKEVEIRQFPGAIDLNSSESINATWGVASVIDRVAFPSTLFTAPIYRYGEYTYLLRVRDTSDLESEEIRAVVVNTQRPPNFRVYKSYNEANPGVSFITRDGQPFPTSNVHPELDFPSFSEVINGGLVLSDSSNTDNSNGSAEGFSVYASNTNILTSGNNPTAIYTTQIRDMGNVVKGTVRIAPTVFVSNPGITFSTSYQTVVSGVTDANANDSILVDEAFSGIGRVLGFDNVVAATTTYNAFHQTLTSGGPLGNVYAIRNPGQYEGDVANANSFSLIAGTVNANAIVLGEHYYANGNPSGSNSAANLAISGNSYELVNLLQFGDSEATITFLGTESTITQNLVMRFATDNVFYSAAANGVSGYPGHGNTNANAFTDALNNAELGWKKYIPGEQQFRYFQISLELTNLEPATSEVLLSELQYEVDIREQTVKKEVAVTSVDGVVVDYAYAGYVETPAVVVTPISTDNSIAVTVSNVSNISCNVRAFNTQNNNPIDYSNVYLVVTGI